MSDHPQNRLKDSASPYLRSAAHQPIDWHEWGEAAFMKTAQGERRVRRGVMAEFDVGGLPPGTARDRQCDHRKPVIRGGDGLRPVRGNVGRDDKYLRQAEGGLGRKAQFHMPAMNRVEGAAKNADASRRQALRA